jgi:uncharacterized membrane protein
LLFWLSLMPFATAWMAQNHFATLPVAIYGVDLLAAGIAYYVLARAIISADGPSSPLAAAIGTDRKGVVSVVCYAVAIPLALVSRWLSLALYAAVAIIWLIPDRRLEPAPS